MRQEEESEIIQLTMGIRNGKSLQPFKGKEVQIIEPKDLVSGMYTWADQILVAKNLTRRTINNQMRKTLFNVENTKPIEGDKIICLRNDWDHPSAAGDIAVNGTIGTISNIRYNHNIPMLNPMMIADFLPENYTQDEAKNAVKDVYFRNVNMDYKLFTTGEETVNKDNFKSFPKIWRPQTYDYAYAITVHKSQGSEYDKVLVFEEYLKGGEHARWLYTAATRAKKRLVIVKNFR